MISSIALAQAKEGLNFMPGKVDYSGLFKESLKYVDGLKPEILDLVLHGKVPIEYEELTFKKAMDEEMSINERIWLINEVEIWDEYIEHRNLLDEALSDFCESGLHRVIVMNKNGVKTKGDLEMSFPDEVELKKGIAVWI